MVERRSAEIARGFGKLRVEARQRRVAGEDDEGQVVVDEAGDDGAFGVEHRRRLAGVAEPAQQLCDQAFAVEQHDPGIGADQVVGPERQHGEEQETGCRRRGAAAIA